MDDRTKWIIGGGILVGVVMLFGRGGSSRGGVADIAIAQINANAQARAAAISAQPAIESAFAQREQVRLAASNDFFKTRYAFFGAAMQNATARQGQFFAFGNQAQKMAYADKADKRANATRIHAIDAAVQLKKQQAELGALVSANRDASQAFAKIFG